MTECTKIFKERILEPNNKKVLRDIRKNGKHRKWRTYKEKSLAVAYSYTLFQDVSRYSEKIGTCASYLKFLGCPSGHGKRLIEARFCRSRMCTMCQWRKSLVVFDQVLSLIHAQKERYISDRPLLLTLTVPNVRASELSACIDRLTKGWKYFSKRKIFKNSIRSWFRTLEVTYNEKLDNYHPHLHVLLVVPKKYFDRKRGLYIEHDTFLSMWQEVTKLPEITQVDIRTVRKKKRKALESVSAEVSKYAAKPSNYIKPHKSKKGRFEANSKVLETLHKSLKGRKLVAVGGLFTELKKKLKLEDVEKANLVHITEDEKPCLCDICQSTLLEELYSWQIGERQYLKTI